MKREIYRGLKIVVTIAAAAPPELYIAEIRVDVTSGVSVRRHDHSLNVEIKFHLEGWARFSCAHIYSANALKAKYWVSCLTLECERRQEEIKFLKSNHISAKALLGIKYACQSMLVFQNVPPSLLRFERGGESDLKDRGRKGRGGSIANLTFWGGGVLMEFSRKSTWQNAVSDLTVVSSSTFFKKVCNLQ